MYVHNVCECLYNILVEMTLGNFVVIAEEPCSGATYEL